MNKHLMALWVAVLFICVGLSGCVEETEKEEENTLFLWVYGVDAIVSIDVNDCTICYKRYIDGFEGFTITEPIIKGNNINKIEVTHHRKSVLYYVEDIVETKTIAGDCVDIDVTWLGGITIKAG